MKFPIIRKGAYISALFLFIFLWLNTPLNALPLTETIYMVPEYDVEIYLHEEIYRVKDDYRKETAGLGFGATARLALWIQFEYLHQGLTKEKKHDIGDLFFKSKFYIGDYFNNIFHIGILLNIRFPLAKSAYASELWRNLAMGKNEITLGIFTRIDLKNIIFFHLNVLYTLREGVGEDYYGGFYINPVSEDTWKNFFGLNPWSTKSFLSIDRLKNDYTSFSLAVNSNLIYPVVPFIEIYGSVRVSRKKIDTGNLPIEGAGLNPLLVSAGLRFFFNQRIYLGLYTVQNCIRHHGYLLSIYGIELSMQL